MFVGRAAENWDPQWFVNFAAGAEQLMKPLLCEEFD